MSRASRGRGDDRPTVDPWGDGQLAELGLVPGMPVRFRRRPSERWHDAVIERRERDGSIGLRDEKGAARSIAAEQIEVRRTGPRGGVIWQPLVEVAAAVEQRRLL